MRGRTTQYARTLYPLRQQRLLCIASVYSRKLQSTTSSINETLLVTYTFFERCLFDESQLEQALQ